MVDRDPDDDGWAGRVLRGSVLTVGFGLAIAATAVLLLTEDPKFLRLAVVGALWAFVLVAVIAARRPAPTGDGGVSRQAVLEMRRTYELELEREVAARREYELQLEVYLRRELESGLRADVSVLRQEMQQLRGELVDRLDGELRMERIEVTRLIGGSLEALRDEARRLGLSMPDPQDDYANQLPYAEAQPAPPPPPQQPQPDPYRADPYLAYQQTYGAETGYTAPASYGHTYPSYPSYPDAAAYQQQYQSPAYQEPVEPPLPRTPPDADPLATTDPNPPSTGRRRRAREENEPNEVMSRLLGRD